MANDLITDMARQARTQRFRHMANQFHDLARQVLMLADLFDDSASNCRGCGSAVYHNWPQRQMRARVTGAAERLREISVEIRRSATDDQFIGNDECPVTMAEQAGLLLDQSAEQTSDTMFAIPASTYEVVRMALGMHPSQPGDMRMDQESQT